MTWMKMMDRRRKELDEKFGGRGLYPWLGPRTKNQHGHITYLGRPVAYSGYTNNSLEGSDAE